MTNPRFIIESEEKTFCDYPYCSGHVSKFLLDRVTKAKLSRYPLPDGAIIDVINFVVACLENGKMR